MTWDVKERRETKLQQQQQQQQQQNDSAILLGFENTINPQNFIKIIRAIFENNEFFFLMWTTLNFRLRGKQLSS